MIKKILKKLFYKSEISYLTHYINDIDVLIDLYNVQIRDLMKEDTFVNSFKIKEINKSIYNLERQKEWLEIKKKELE
jgi:hypothetical protein